MEQKIIKILNILKKFQLDEVATYMECETVEIQPYIENLIADGVIKQISTNDYVYDISKDVATKRKLRQKTVEVNIGFNLNKQELFNLENYKDFPAKKVLKKKADLDYYNSCDEKTKKLLIKHIVLFNLVGNPSLHNQTELLKQISKKYPDYKMNAQWYRRKYNRYLKEGLAGLYHNKLSTIDTKVYDEFKQLYLTPRGYTQEQCYEILMLKGGYKEGDIPTLPTFIHRLKHEFSKDAIKKMRSHNKLMPVSAEVEALQIHKKRKKPCEVYFEDAANDYWRAIVENNIEVGKHRQEFISKLITYFRGIKLGEIVREKVIDFKNTLLSEGVTFNIVKGLIGMLFTILKASGIKIDFEIYQDLNHSSKIYTQEEVKKIILNDSPEALVVALGLRLGELQALKYEDFDFENKLVTIKRRNEYGRIKEFKQAKFIRQCMVPDTILNRIDKSKKGFIYGKITMPTYESCLYAHIMLMQTQHIPLNIIAHNMGHSSISSFFVTYHYLFPKHLEENFNILKPLNLEEHQC